MTSFSIVISVQEKQTAKCTKSILNPCDTHLNRYLKSSTVQKTFDIKDNESNEAIMRFKTAITELKISGNNTTEPHPTVLEEDREKYTLLSILVQIRPLCKVQWDKCPKTFLLLILTMKLTGNMKQKHWRTDEKSPCWWQGNGVRYDARTTS